MDVNRAGGNGGASSLADINKDHGLDLGADKESSLGSQPGDLFLNRDYRSRMFGKNQFAQQPGNLQSQGARRGSCQEVIKDEFVGGQVSAKLDYLDFAAVECGWQHEQRRLLGQGFDPLNHPSRRRMAMHPLSF